MEIEQVRVTVDDLAFDALVAGPDDGPLVVLLHGFPETAHEWCHVMAPLAERGYQVVAPTTRGLSPGARPSDVSDYHVRYLAADVLGIAATRTDGPFHLVGHDWGALIAWYVAATRPDCVRTLTSVSVPHPRPFAEARAADPDQRTKSSYIETFRTPGAGEAFFLGDDAATLRAALAELDPADADVHHRVLSDPGAMTAGLNYYRAWDDALDRIGPVEVATLFVWGSADPALGRTAATATARWVRAPYRFEVLDGVGHWIPELASDRLTTLLLDHLRSADAAR
jgi:pimeloyl-ACP methyl ester carboxylesterase